MNDDTIEVTPGLAQNTQRNYQESQSNRGSRPTEEQPSRVWRACLECRKKKNKCDGKSPCNPCQTKSRVCTYPETNDNASTSRQISTAIEARCHQLDELCQKMETLVGRFNETVEGLGTQSLSSAPSQSYHPILPISIGQNPLADDNSATYNDYNQSSLNDLDFVPGISPTLLPNHLDIQLNVEDEDDQSLDDISEKVANNAADHIMATDSYGKLRFVGGTSNMVMIEALKGLTPSSGTVSSPSESRTSIKSPSILELPFFTRGQTWPRLPGLSRGHQLPRPPRYLSDLLVNIYFEQLHYTMPVIYQPHFMLRYNLLLNCTSPEEIDEGFLSVFFAVCTCASGLLPRDTGTSSVFTGLNYYESAISLHYASTGEGSIEQVQCLALLSMCSAGWNTLAQSWKFAGQAVRAAQDLGLHRSPARGTGETLKEELCRRIWWSVYGLDRVLSHCLGRPVGVEDSDCDCEIPLDMDDYQLEEYCKQSQPIGLTTHGPSSLTGFIVFSQLSQISGRISRLMNLPSLRRNKSNAVKARKFRQRIRDLDTELSNWLQNVPDVIKFSANNTENASPHLKMCVVSYIFHAACVINLHRPLIPDGYVALGNSSDNSSYLQCVNAARSCIQVAELIKEHVPSSHHLTYSTHQLALSGIFLIQNLGDSYSDCIDTVETCIRCLTDLETVSVGANRSRLILEELLKHAKSSRSLKRPHSEFEDFNITNFMMVQDLFPGFT